MSTSAKIQPQAPDIEQAVLGSMLIEKDAVQIVCDLLKPEMFYVNTNKIVFESILSLHLKGSQIDFLTLEEDLRARKKIEEIGGVYYLTRLTNSVVSSAHTVSHCNIIIEKHLLRKLISIGGELYSKSFDHHTNPFELIEKAEKELHQISLSINSKDYHHIQHALIETVEDLETKRNRSVHLTGVSTGYKELNISTCGWQATDLIILAARPKCGKTAMALNLGLNAALDGTGVGFFSMEMSATQLVKRVLANKASVYLQSLRDARLDNEQMLHIFKEGVQKLSGIPFFIDDTAALSIQEFKSKARRMVVNDKVGLIIVDYLQLMQGDKENGKSFNREQMISNIARQIKITAKELNVPIIALSQLSRAVEQRNQNVPVLSDLRESGALEQDADMVCFLFKPSEAETMSDASKASSIYFKIAAYRNGEPKQFEYEFNGGFQRFSEKGSSAIPQLPGNWKSIEKPYDEDPF
jgi:replicative DNA helicase